MPVPPAGTRVSHYEYQLPDGHIAAWPAERRDQSRLMVVPQAHGAASPGSIQHRCFADLPDLMRAGDLLVVNESRVLPARLLGTRAGGGAGEILLLNPAGDDRSVDGETRLWEAMARPGRKLGEGKRLQIADDFTVVVEEVLDEGIRRVRLETEGSVLDALERHGHIPLPPYLGREDEAADRERYQTVYAREAGSVAAPTAGLHFTPELLAQLQAMGVDQAAVTLHVGAGTFRPVDVEDPSEHPMHAEVYDVPQATVDAVARCRERGGRVWAVGTTVVRTLETVARDVAERSRPVDSVPADSAEAATAPGSGTTEPALVAASGVTRLFIRPSWDWRVVDGLITNFHLPRSTLLMLVAARLGYERTMEAYRVAVDEGYRFYSYGDAMVIPPVESST